MAIDNTPPRLKLIVTIAAITVVTLISLDFILKSYYAMMTDDASREKVAPTKDLDEHRKAEQAALGAAALPVDQAMTQLAKAGRAEIVAPKQSDDLGPMTGWSKMPKPAPTPHVPVRKCLAQLAPLVAHVPVSCHAGTRRCWRRRQFRSR